MSAAEPTMEGPPLLQGAPLPLLQLSADAFERFVHAVLVALGPELGFEHLSAPTSSADDGFDCFATQLGGGKGVCVQCKRYTDPLQPNAIGHELAKVALRSKIDNSEVLEHWFVAAGGLSKYTKRYQRAPTREQWIESALAAPKTKAFSRSLLNDATTRGLVADEVIRSYVAGLEQLEFWGPAELEARMAIRWDRFAELVGKFFRVEWLLLENPRPNFDLAQYLDTVLGSSRQGHVSRRVEAAPLPTNLVTSDLSSAAPEAPLLRFSGSPGLEELPVAPSRNTVLTAPGGAGKSTGLNLIAQNNAATPGGDALVPVLLPAGRFSGDIDSLIHRVLGVTTGHWRSLPFPFLFLVDGLNEIGLTAAQLLCAELDAVIDRGKDSAVLTTRPGGFGRPLACTSIDSCARLLPLSISDIRGIAKLHLSGEEESGFLLRFLELIRRSRLVPSPFVVELAAAAYHLTGDVPESPQGLLAALVDARLKRDRHLAGALAPDVPDVHPQLVLELARRLATSMATAAQPSFQKPEAEVLTILASSVAEINGLANLSSTAALRLLQHYEFVVVEQDWVTFTHEIVASYLAAPGLAEQFGAGRLRVHDLRPESLLFVADRCQDEIAFLDELYDCDRSAACEAARHASSDGSKHVLQRLVLESPDTPFAAATLSALIGQLGNADAIPVLEQWVRDGPPGCYKPFQLRRAPSGLEMKTPSRAC